MIFLRGVLFDSLIQHRLSLNVDVFFWVEYLNAASFLDLSSSLASKLQWNGNIQYILAQYCCITLVSYTQSRDHVIRRSQHQYTPISVKKSVQSNGETWLLFHLYLKLMGPGVSTVKSDNNFFMVNNFDPHYRVTNSMCLLYALCILCSSSCELFFAQIISLLLLLHCFLVPFLFILFSHRCLFFITVVVELNKRSN